MGQMNACHSQNLNPLSLTARLILDTAVGIDLRNFGHSDLPVVSVVTGLAIVNCYSST